MHKINGSVGVGGRNSPEDVKVVQSLFIKAGKVIGAADGIVGPRTKAAIIGFQYLFMKKPDGRIDPGGRSLAKLNTQASKPIAPQIVKASAPQVTSSELASDWSGDSSQWTQEKKLSSLRPIFRTKVKVVVTNLTKLGFQPKIVFGWRSVAVQKELLEKGRTKVSFSFHNAQTREGIPSALAVDLIDKRWAWNEPDCHKFFKQLGAEANKQGLVWGGDWKSFKDWAHIQGAQNSELGKVKKESGL